MYGQIHPVLLDLTGKNLQLICIYVKNHVFKSVFYTEQDEYNNLALGRRDFKLPGFPRFNPHFQGDIREVFIWYEALNQFQVKKHAKDHGKTASKGYETISL